MLTIATVILVVILAIVSIICVASNLLVCLAIWLRRPTKSPARYFIFSLAVNDLMIGAISIPFYMWLETKLGSMSEAEIKHYVVIFDSIDATLNFSSIVHLCLMSIDRAIAVAKPLYHRQFATRGTVLKLLVLPWTISAIFPLTYAILERTPLLYFIYFIILTVLFYLAPIFLIITCYVIIFKEIKRRNNTQMNTHRLNEVKLVRTTFAIIIVFLVCWTPFVCLLGHLLVTTYVTGTRPKESWYYAAIKSLTYLNSAINPYIYAIFHSQFRKAFTDIAGMCKKKAQVSQESNGNASYIEAKVWCLIIVCTRP